MLRQAETDRTTDSVKSDGSKYQQKPDAVEDVWQRASTESPFVRAIKETTELLGHAIHDYGMDLQKKVNNLKRF